MCSPCIRMTLLDLSIFVYVSGRTELKWETKCSGRCGEITGNKERKRRVSILKVRI